VSLIKTITSAFGKMVIVAALLGAFLVGLVSVVWLSLRGEEVKVPEVVGKDVLESEKELAALGLKLKRRANRFSEEKPNTILEQLPKSGDSVKTGQTISVVVSRINPEGSEEPAVLDKEDTSNTANSAVNPDAPANKKKEVKKPVSTTRDVESTKTNKNSNIASKNGSTANKNNSTANKNDTNKADSNSSNKNGSTANTATKANTTVANKPVVKPAANTGGDIRPRKVPQ
jgi:beta-lactam-binding protein with PASTA domain